MAPYLVTIWIHCKSFTYFRSNLTELAICSSYLGFILIFLLHEVWIIKCFSSLRHSTYIMKLIGTVYRNSSSSTNNNYLSFQIFPRRSCEPQVQERACPTRTYACLAKHHSKWPIGTPRLNLVPASPKLYKVAFHNVLVFLSWTPKSLQQLTQRTQLTQLY